MNILILPGFSIKNRLWLEQADAYLSKNNVCITHEWTHWRTGDNGDFLVEKELPFIKKKIHVFPQVAVVAKSIGTYIAAHLIAQESHVKFTKVVFCGIPLNDLNPINCNQLTDSIRTISPSSLMCIQNSEDPHGTYDQVRHFLSEINVNYKVHLKESSDHEYLYFDDIAEFLSSL